MGQNCNWDSEERNCGEKNIGWYLLPVPDCQKDPQFSVTLLLAVPEAVLSHTESRSRLVVQSIKIELLIVPEAVLYHIELRRSRSAVQSILCVAPWRPRGSLVPYKNKDQISCTVHSLCCSLLSQRQSCPIQKWGADQPCSPFSVLLLAVPEEV